jgi:hypothetical protein
MTLLLTACRSRTFSRREAGKYSTAIPQITFFFTEKCDPKEIKAATKMLENREHCFDDDDVSDSSSVKLKTPQRKDDGDGNDKESYGASSQPKNLSNPAGFGFDSSFNSAASASSFKPLPPGKKNILATHGT